MESQEIKIVEIKKDIEQVKSKLVDIDHSFKKITSNMEEFTKKWYENMSDQATIRKDVNIANDAIVFIKQDLRERRKELDTKISEIEQKTIESEAAVKEFKNMRKQINKLTYSMVSQLAAFALSILYFIITNKI